MSRPLFLLVALTACAPRQAPPPVAVVAAPQPDAAGPDDPSAWIQTDTGLRYQDLEPGHGSLALPGVQVRAHYTGWLEDGTLFDSSHTRGVPITFLLGSRQVIPGWEEGVAGMRVGGRRKLVIPFHLAYGEAGRPPTIPPRSTLIFEVELVEVLPLGAP